MEGLRISQVAELAGFSPSAVRYYESVGVVPAPERSPAGYRVYDDRAVARLRFIGRAKQLGCTLDEITELVAAWDGEDCEPVRERLQALIDTKVGEARTRTAEVVAFTAQLQEAAASLRGTSSPGPCGEECACSTIEPPSPGAQDGTGLHASDPAIACTLAGEDVAPRIAEWQRVLGRVEDPEAIDGGVRFSLPPEVPLEELVALARAEQECCSFFSFAFTIDARGAALEVRAPAAGQAMVAALFGGATSGTA